MSSYEPMDKCFAVFNQHANKAGERAARKMRRECPDDLAVVQQRKKDGGGIMAIFEPPYHEAFDKYATLVQGFVNETAVTADMDALR